MQSVWPKGLGAGQGARSAIAVQSIQVQAEAREPALQSLCNQLQVQAEAREPALQSLCN